MKFRNTIIVCFVVTGMSLLSSCSKWLDVQPASQFDEDQMFETEDGFKDALYGIYYTLSRWELYGMEMSWGSMDVMGQYYDMGSNHSMYKAKLYDYESKGCKGMINGIWINMYNAIAEINNLLYNLEKKKPGELRYYNYYKGEALALRGLLHFELSRLFGPNYRADAQRIVLPYVTVFGNETTPHESLASVYKKAIADAEAALGYLSGDPVLKANVSAEMPESDKVADSFLDNRQNKMNAAAVKALLARIYFSMGEDEKAGNYAKEVIEEANLRLVSAKDLEGSNPDRIFSSEMIFGVSWYNKDYFEMAASFFDAPAYLTTQILKAYNDVLKADGYLPSDIRRVWFKDEEANDLTRFQRYKDAGKKYQVAVIRLSEMYLIAAEAMFPNDPGAACGYFNTYAENRHTEGFAPEVLPTEADFLTRISQERRREFFGDGQLFFYHKLTGRDIVINAQERVVMSEKITVLPLPEDEIKYGKLK